MPESRKKQNFISYRSSNGCTSRVSFHSGFDLEGGGGFLLSILLSEVFVRMQATKIIFHFNEKIT